jgi:predicted acyltransferase
MDVFQTITTFSMIVIFVAGVHGSARREISSSGHLICRVCINSPEVFPPAELEPDAVDTLKIA